MSNWISTLCGWCGEKNWVDRGEVEQSLKCCPNPILCWKCKKVQFPNAIKPFDDTTQGNWLECIKYKGPMKNVPTGVITVNGITQYITSEGELKTRGEFISEFKTDPAIYIYKRIEIHQQFSFGKSDF